jgi:hypothetical protein
MRQYPHGLDEEILPEDLEMEQETIEEYEEELAEAVEEENSLFIKGLGEAYYDSACFRYALGEAAANVKGAMRKALEHFFTAFQMGVTTDVYEFIHLLSLALSVGDGETAESLAATERSRYQSANVEAEEIVYTIAALLSAMVMRDETTIAEILEANNPDKIDTKKIYRYDRIIFFPLLPLLIAVQKRDASRLTAAMQTRETEWVRFFSRQEQKNDPEALIDMPGLAVAALARARAINFNDTSVYRPYDLIGGR